jgi:hypothetical protein
MSTGHRTVGVTSVAGFRWTHSSRPRRVRWRRVIPQRTEPGRPATGRSHIGQGEDGSGCGDAAARSRPAAPAAWWSRRPGRLRRPAKPSASITAPVSARHSQVRRAMIGCGTANVRAPPASDRPSASSLAELGQGTGLGRVSRRPRPPARRIHWQIHAAIMPQRPLACHPRRDDGASATTGQDVLKER